MRTLGILLVSSSLVLATNGLAQEEASSSATIDVNAITKVIKNSPDSPDAKTALHQLEQVADKGNANALYQLGDLYSRGGGSSGRRGESSRSLAAVGRRRRNFGAQSPRRTLP